MLRISKRAQYGLRAMVCLAKSYKSKQVLSTKTISKKEGIPFDFLEKIVSQLEKENLIDGKKGVLGGYVLSKSPKKISANDVVSILENNKKPVDCSFCGRKSQCLTKNVWLKVELALNKTLKSITLQDLIS
jgi:Rrf2 family protein